MPWHTVTYKREALYEPVWPKPIRTVARRDGMSDGALDEICKKLGVPRPGRG